MATLDRKLIRLSGASPGRLAHVAAQALSGEDGLLRVAAVFALGRAAETSEPDLVAQIEATLVERAAFVPDDLLMAAVATALLHVWGDPTTKHSQLSNDTPRTTAVSSGSPQRCPLP